MLVPKNNLLSLKHTLFFDVHFFTYLAHVSLKQCVGHSITKTIIEMAQEHISLSLGARDTAKKSGNKLEKFWLSSAKPALAYGAPDCPVPRLARRRTRRSREKAKAPRLKITGLSGESTAPAANGRQRNQRAACGPRQRSVGHTGLSGAPTGPKVQRSGVPDKEGDWAPDNYCSCLVVQGLLAALGLQKGPLGAWSTTPSIL
jgi:hypothetical protein